MKKALKIKAYSNRGDVIRTRDLYVPNVALYQAEPHPEIFNSAYFDKHKNYDTIFVKKNQAI